MLQQNSLLTMEDFLAYQLFAYLNDPTIFHVNHEYHNKHFNYLMHKISIDKDPKDIEQFISKVRLELIKHKNYISPGQEQHILHLYLAIKNVILNARDQMQVEQFISLNVLTIGCLIRLNHLTPLCALFLERLSKNKTFGDVLIAIMPLVEHSPERDNILIKVQRVLTRETNFNPINRNEFKNIRLNWFVLANMLNRTERYIVLDDIKSRIFPGFNNSHNILLALQGFCHSQSLQLNFNPNIINTLLNAYNFAPHIKTAHNIVINIANNDRRAFLHTNHMQSLLDNFNNVMSRRYSLLFFENVMQNAPHILNKNQLSELGNKLFLILINPKTFSHELRSVIGTIKKVANKDYNTHIRLSRFINTIIDNPSYHHIRVLSLYPMVIDQLQVRATLNRLWAILHPQNWRDKFRFVFENVNFKKLALEAFIGIIKSNLKIPRYWHESPVELFVDFYHDNLSLKHQTGEALEFLAEKYPYFFTERCCNFLIHHSYNSQTFSMPALGRLITNNHPIIQDKIDSSLLLRLFKAFTLIGAYFFNQMKIEIPIEAILTKHPEIINHEHVTHLLDRINRNPAKIIYFLFLIAEKRPELISTRNLLLIEDGLNLCLNEVFPINEYKKTINLFTHSSIFEKERIASFLQFHIMNNHRNNAKQLCLQTYIELLLKFKYDTQFIMPHLVFLVGLLDSDQTIIRTMAFDCVMHFKDDELIHNYLSNLDNEYVNLIRNETDFKQKFDALGFDIFEKLLRTSNPITHNQPTFNQNGEIDNIYATWRQSNTFTAHPSIINSSIFYTEDESNPAPNTPESFEESKLNYTS